jgi:hypothetical protein
MPLNKHPKDDLFDGETSDDDEIQQKNKSIDEILR